MSDWIEGEPSENGLYACEPDGGSLMYVLRIKDGVKMWTDGDTNVRYRCTVRRHYRLPEPQQPLKPLRRFTAKIKREPVTGCERRFAPPHSGELFCERRDGSWFFAYHHDLTDLQWIDEP